MWTEKKSSPKNDFTVTFKFLKYSYKIFHPHISINFRPSVKI